VIGHRLGEVAFGAAGADEVHGRGVRDVAVRAGRLDFDAVGAPDRPQGGGGPGQEVPAGDGAELVGAGVAQDVRHAIVVLVDVDRREDDVWCGAAQVVVGVDELLGDQRADVGGVRVHEFQHDDLAAQAR